MSLRTDNDVLPFSVEKFYPSESASLIVIASRLLTQRLCSKEIHKPREFRLSAPGPPRRDLTFWAAVISVVMPQMRSSVRPSLQHPLGREESVSESRSCNLFQTKAPDDFERFLMLIEE